MIEDRRAGPRHAAILAAVVVAVMVVPTLLGDQGEALTGFVLELLSPVGLLLLTIQFLSSGSGSFVAGIFSSGDPNTIHRASGSPFGVVLLLLLVLLLLYNRVSIFGGDDDSGDWLYIIIYSDLIINTKLWWFFTIFLVIFLGFSSFKVAYIYYTWIVASIVVRT